MRFGRVVQGFGYGLGFTALGLLGYMVQGFRLGGDIGYGQGSAQRVQPKCFDTNTEHRVVTRLASRMP